MGISQAWQMMVMNSKQLLLDFPRQTKFDAADFMPMSCNNDALKALEATLARSFGGLYIYGEEGCGKSHLLHVAAGRLHTDVLTPATLPANPTALRTAVVDMVDEATPTQEEALFHLYNHLMNSQGLLIMAGRRPADQLQGLPDLTSRLKTLQHVKMAMPDTQQLELLLVKFAADHRLQIDAAVVRYLLRRAERSPRMLEGLVGKLDEASLTEKRAVTIPLVKEVVSQLKEGGAHANS